jgi:hypothetical protein
MPSEEVRIPFAFWALFDHAEPSINARLFVLVRYVELLVIPVVRLELRNVSEESSVGVPITDARVGYADRL